jgi:hypothetical protein
MKTPGAKKPLETSKPAKHARKPSTAAAKPKPAPPATKPALMPRPYAQTKPDSKTFAIIDKMYSAEAEGVSPPTGTVINWWGQFSDELPDPFCLPHGGHGWLEARDLEHAAEVVGRLRDHVLAMTAPSDPKTKLERTYEWAGESWYRWMLADGRQMTLEFKRRSKLTPSQKRDLKSL